jgi:MFS family permease
VRGEGGATPARAFAVVLHRPSLRRVELAWAASHLGHVALAVALAVYAYDLGGASAVVLVSVLRVAAAAIVTPFAAVLADRLPPVPVIVASNAARLLLAATVTALTRAGGGHWLVYILCILVALAGTPFRPARAALLPSLVDRPGELTAANAVSSTIEGLGFFTGPAIAAVLLTQSSITAVFAFCTGMFAFSTVPLLRPLARTAVDRESHERTAAPRAAELLAGMRTIGGTPGLRMLVGVFTAQTFVDGALAVLLVVTASRLLRDRSADVGWLDAAVGIGGLLGSLAATRLAGRRRLTPALLVGMALWGAPFLAVAARPGFALAFVAFAVIGIGNILVDAAGFTLLRRAIDDRLLDRVYSAFEALSYVSIALGALAVAPLVWVLGARWALVATGLFLPVVGLLARRRLLRLDDTAVAPALGVGLLQALPVFAPLPALSLEQLALQLVPLSAPTGTRVITQGESGDHYYILMRGGAQVVIDGEPVGRLVAGDGFGEIALLRDVPRTATVTTTEPSELLSLDRQSFLEAVNADPQSFAAANETANRRLGLLSGTI